MSDYMIGSYMIGKHVLVRTLSAGVHIGTMVGRDRKEVVLQDARRIWYWMGAFTLSAVAVIGLDPKGSKLSVAVPDILLTEAIEVIPTSRAARATFDASEAHYERA